MICVRLFDFTDIRRRVCGGSALYVRDRAEPGATAGTGTGQEEPAGEGTGHL